MLATTYSALLSGLEAIKVTIEIALTPGLPTLQIVGLPSQTIAESKERITAAIAIAGIKAKAQRTVVNLAPADVHKNSSAFELPITAGLLHLYGVIPPISATTLLFGELSLTGDLQPLTGALPLILGAKKLGFTTVMLPAANQLEASLVRGITCIPIGNLKEFIAHQQATAVISPSKYQSSTNLELLSTQSEVIEKSSTFNEIVGQDAAKKVLEIAAAGGHNVLLQGPPGTGKSMLAESFAHLLPPLTEEETVEVYSLHSIAGKIAETGIEPTGKLSTRRPFRRIHHTISQVGLIGGGTKLTPGEISLAHRGVLFMDELPEFPRHVLESLRQPLEAKSITISRASGTIQYPANFILIAAANPCPCGYKGSEKKPCTCSEFHQQQYTHKISGPLLDRIDITSWVGEVRIATLGQQMHKNNDYESIEHSTVHSTLLNAKKRIAAAREIQKLRFKGYSRLHTNADMTPQDIARFCRLEPNARHLLIRTAEKYNFSPRKYFRMLKVAQTLADLDTSPVITKYQVSNLLQTYIEENNLR